MENHNKKPEINDLIINLMIQSHINELMLRDVLKRNNLNTPSSEENNEIAKRAKESVNNLLSTFKFQ